MRGVPSGSFDRSSSTTGSASGLSLPITPTYISRPSMYSSISTGESKLACSQSIRSISSRIELTTALNSMPIEPSSRAGLTMTGNCRSCEKSRRPRKRLGEHRRVDAVEGEDLLRDRLVLRQHQAVGAGAGVPLADQLEEAGDLEVGGVVVGKRLGEVEDQIALHPRQRQQALLRAVELVHHRLVSELGQRLGDFLLDFFLVERARRRATSRPRRPAPRLSSTSTRS